MNVWHFFSSHRAEILTATREHLTLVVISMAIAVVVAVPLGLALVTHPRLRSPALALASVFQTIPSLALFGFLIPLPFLGGIGMHTAIVALVLYAILPILRNTYVGLTGVDPAILEAAEAMGMTAEQARSLSVTTFVGASRLAQESNEPIDVLRQRVTSKGGTTAAALEQMQASGLHDKFVEAVFAARARSRELARTYGDGGT